VTSPEEHPPQVDDGLRARRALGLTVVVLCGLGFAVRNAGFFLAEEFHIYRDLAANLLAIERARDFEQLVGFYSKLGSSPGPASVYWLAFGAELFPYLPAALARYTAAQLLIDVAAIGLVVWLASHWLTRRWESVLLAACLWIGVGSSPESYSSFSVVSIWGPAMAAASGVLGIYCASRIAEGDWRLLPIATLAAIYAAHSHTVVAVLVAVVGAAALRTAVSLHRASRTPAAIPAVPVALAATFLILSSLPVLYQQWTSPRGNIADLLTVAFSYSRSWHPFELMAVFWKPYVAPLQSFFEVSSLGRPPIVSSLLISIALAIGCRAGWRRAPPELRSWMRWVFASIGVSFAFAWLLPGYPKERFFYFAYGLAGVIYFFVLRDLAERANEHWNRKGVGAAVMLTTAAAVGVWTVKHPIDADDYRMRPDYPGIEAHFFGENEGAKILHAQTKLKEKAVFRHVFGLALHLRRRGEDFRIAEQHAGKVGVQHRLRGDEEEVLLFSARPLHPRWEQLEFKNFRVAALPLADEARPSDPTDVLDALEPLPVGANVPGASPRLAPGAEWREIEGGGLATRAVESWIHFRAPLGLEDRSTRRLRLRLQSDERIIVMASLDGRFLGSVRVERPEAVERVLPFPAEFMQPGALHRLRVRLPLLVEGDPEVELEWLRIE